MKTLKINGKILLTCSLLSSFLAANHVLAEDDIPEEQIKALQQEQAYKQHQQAFEQQDKEQYEQQIHEERRFNKQKKNVERRQAKEMEEQKQRYLQAMEKQQPADNKSTGNDISQQATQSELESEEELKEYDERLKMQDSY